MSGMGCKQARNETAPSQKKKQNQYDNMPTKTVTFYLGRAVQSVLIWESLLIWETCPLGK